MVVVAIRKQEPSDIQVWEIMLQEAWKMEALKGPK
jgi:hypothetical protein